MKAAKSGKGDGRAEARRLAHLVEQAIDNGADSVEGIHRSIASMPLDVLERLDLFKETVKDVRKVQDTSIGAIYELIHKVNREVGKLATEMLQRPAARRAAPRKAVKTRAASAHAR
jgi:uncharacterized NAD-dependent epimerase/dehydratase family protein